MSYRSLKHRDSTARARRCTGHTLDCWWLLVAVAGCSEARSPAEVSDSKVSDPAGVIILIEPPERPPATEEDPPPVEKPSSDKLSTILIGRWQFIHGGEEWFVARFERRDNKIVADIEFNPDISWATFVIDDIHIARGSVVIRGVDDDGSSEYRDITLKIKSATMLEGDVQGHSYDGPIPVVAKRLR